MNLTASARLEPGGHRLDEARLRNAIAAAAHSTPLA